MKTYYVTLSMEVKDTHYATFTIQAETEEEAKTKALEKGDKNDRLFEPSGNAEYGSIALDQTVEV